MSKIQVFADKNFQPLHLAVRSERIDDPDKDLRSVCGANTAGLQVLSLDTEIKLHCKDCQWQLEHWLKSS